MPTSQAPISLYEFEQEGCRKANKLTLGSSWPFGS